MKPSNIKVGHTYHNRGKGQTRRKVLAIGDEHRPGVWYGGIGVRPDEPGVEYLDSKGVSGNLYLSSFASWAGGESAEGITKESER